MEKVLSSPFTTQAINTAPPTGDAEDWDDVQQKQPKPGVAKAKKSERSPPSRRLTPAEAVLAGAVLFPDSEEQAWFEKTISLPKQFEGTPPAVEVDDASVTPFSYIVYVIFSGFLVVLVLIAILAYLISFAPSPPPLNNATSTTPAALCYYDPTMSTKLKFPFTRTQLCVECCSYVVYDGLDIDATGSILERTGAVTPPVDSVADWLALKQTARLKVLAGLRFAALPQFTTAADPPVVGLINTLRTSYTGWDGAVFTKPIGDVAKETVLYEALHKEVANKGFLIWAHILPASIESYDWTSFGSDLDAIVVETHNFVVQGRAYPPCMYEAGGNIDALNKNLVDVLNLILVPAPHMSSKLVPTVSTVGKKYVFSDPAKEAVGDLVVRPIPDDVSLSMFCQDLASWTLKWENKTKCDTAFNNKHEWIGFESARSVVLKTELVKKKQLMGLAVLNVEQDDQVACSSDTPYLLSAVHRGLTSG